ncbi:helix-turn-helix transcriptional regulator [Burkholderia cenocepacia]|uniref:helix-turn-helix transcriptional regulator n=1 Tax=Burkholderia cenocepacia TaxID=95486 RepID=UPI001CF4744C|nr:transcriptional regulator [Burkholderia cenocepacia]MCA8087522.1 transcriptional regulator [Burkholderia cenocepacia]
MSNATEAASKKEPAGPILPVLPAMGLSKWAQIAPFIPCCRETWRKLVLAGKAPPAIRLSENCTVYKNEEIHRYLADPLGYVAAHQEGRETA